MHKTKTMRNSLFSSSSNHHPPTTPASSTVAVADINNRSGMKSGLKRGPWTPEEDLLLKDFIEKQGEGKWRTLPKKAGLRRCGKSCRLRWMNYLRPSVKRGQIAEDEEDLILRLHRLLGNRWSLIAGRIPGRTDNEIKNYWNTHLSKKLIRLGIDPTTHKPLINSLHISSNSLNQPLQLSPNYNSIHHDAPQNDDINRTPPTDINISTTSSSFTLPPHDSHQFHESGDAGGGEYSYGVDDDVMDTTSLRFDSSGGPSSTNTADQYKHVDNNKEDDDFSSFMKTLIDDDNAFSLSNNNLQVKQSYHHHHHHHHLIDMNTIADDDVDNNFILNNMLNPELELWDI